jgi:hypothetical protein
MARGRIGNRAESAAANWRERPIGPDDITRAQVVDRIFVPQEGGWAAWAWSYAASARRRFAARPMTELFIPADDPWPTFPYDGTPPDPERSAEQNVAHARGREQHFRATGVTLGMARLVVDALGIPNLCEHGGCRRKASCSSGRRRPEWSIYPGPAWPPCVHNALSAGIVRPPVETLLDRLDALIEARLTAIAGQPWAAAERIGLTRLPMNELQPALEAAFKETAA